MKIKNIIVENYNHEYDDEAGMAETNLVTIARAAEGLLDTIEDHENLPEWVQEKIAKVEGMMVTAWNYLESQEAQGVAEDTQRIDSLVTDALKIMRGSEVSDAVAALKTVLGDREYNGRRGHYNFYVRQLMNMYGQQGMAEGELGEGWKEKLGGAALAGAMALGAGGAQARVMPGDDPGINRLTGKPIATQQATDTAPTQSTSSISVAKPQAQYDVDTRILTYKGKQYKWNSDAQATGQGEVVSAPSMAVGSRSMSPTKVELNPNGTYTKAPVNEVTGRVPDPQNYDSDWDYYNDRDAEKPADSDADYENMIDEPNDWFDESREKVGNMDADAFDAAIARMKKLAGAGPLRTVYDPARRVYKNVPTAQQPAKQPQK